MTTVNLDELINQRVALIGKIERVAAENVRAWMVKHGRTHLPVDDERSNALTDDRTELLYGSDPDREAEYSDLDSAVGNMAVRLFSDSAEGYSVSLADLNDYLKTGSDK
ncbi:MULTISPECIES: hypothetical protein [Mycolicibacterium]|uniref:Uncharacterized protein n=1 Tax=Mycolicibacterium alvei TaxID=67081 RepID=A0A6N4V3F8_9MYCO|nr:MULTISPECIES: hypothetical protein [Mycolicibacterium]MCV7003608.1 hypothetical protein [Mycolicibacterium alvei]BBX30434.1 hypothetical protein MALV_55590 [Mycolicibacterium alvei]